MRPTKIVYAVSSGVGSDYKIRAIFSTNKLAEEFKRLVPDPEYNDIEEYELDPPFTDFIKRGYSLWEVHMLVDGTTELIKGIAIDPYSVTLTGHWIWGRTKAPASKDKGIPDILVSTVWAKTEQQAIKIVNEHRTQMIAEGQWN